MAIDHQFTLTKNSILSYLDFYLSILGFCFGFFVFSLYYVIGMDQRDIGLTILSASLLYIVLRNKLLHHNYYIFQDSRSINLLLSSVFWILFTVTTYLLYTNLYFRPTLYFILISIMAGLIGVMILHHSSGESPFSILCMIATLSIQIRAGIWYNYPTFSGSDVYAHAATIDAIASTGHLLPFEIFGKYLFAPLSHIHVAVVQNFLQLDTFDSLFIVAVIGSILIILVYYVGREIADSKVGLLAALLLSVTNSVILYAFQNFTPAVLAFCYFIIMFYFLNRIIISKGNISINISLLICFTILLVFTHQLSTFAILVLIITLLCVHFVSSSTKQNTNKQNDLYINYLLIFIITIVFQWFYSLVTDQRSFFDFVFRPFYSSITEGGGDYNPIELMKGTFVPESLLDSMISNIPFLIIPFFVIGGVYLWLAIKDDKKIQIILPIIVVYAIVYGFPMLGMRNLLVHRWMPFLSVFTCLVIAAYIISLATIHRTRLPQMFVIIGIVGFFCFAMLITPGINKDNPIIRADTTARDTFTSSEVAGWGTIGTMGDKSIIKTDPSYTILRRADLESRGKYTIMSLDYVQGLDPGDSPGSIIVIRLSGFEEPLLFPTGQRGISRAIRLPEDFLKKFNLPRYDLVYSNDQVLGYISK